MLPEYKQCTCKLHIQGHELMAREIILPMPPSENDRLEVNWDGVKNYSFGGFYSNSKRTKKGVLRNSTQYNRWLHLAASMLRKGQLPKLEGEVVVFVTLVFPDFRKRDADNRLKALFDSFTQSGHLIEDDSKIVLHTVEKRVVPRKEFVMAYVFERSQMPDLGIELADSYLQTKAKEMLVVAMPSVVRRSTPTTVGERTEQRLEEVRLQNNSTVQDENENITSELD